MRADGEIGENFLLVKTYMYMVLWNQITTTFPVASDIH